MIPEMTPELWSSIGGGSVVTLGGIGYFLRRFLHNGRHSHDPGETPRWHPEDRQLMDRIVTAQESVATAVTSQTETIKLSVAESHKFRQKLGEELGFIKGKLD